MADDLVGGRRDKAPPCVWRRTEAGDDVVIAAQELRGLDQARLFHHMVGDWDDCAGVGLAGHELQDLAALIVDADDAWCVETAVLKVSEQRVDTRRPWTGAAMDRVADPDGVIQIAAEAPLFVHARKVRRGSRQLTPYQPTDTVTRPWGAQPVADHRAGADLITIGYASGPH